jgi:hypothetical protein
MEDRVKVVTFRLVAPGTWVDGAPCKTLKRAKESLASLERNTGVIGSIERIVTERAKTVSNGQGRSYFHELKPVVLEVRAV